MYFWWRLYLNKIFVLSALTLVLGLSLFSNSAFAIDVTIIHEESTNVVSIFDVINVPSSNNPAVFLFLIPVVSFVFIRIVNSEQPSLIFRKIVSLGIIVILLSWGFSVPGLMATGYWGIAYAEESELNTPPIISYDFNEPNPSGIVFQGDPREVFDSLNPYISLNGENDYLRVKQSATNNLNQLTLSAWIKPDYSNGSPIFTVLSKDNSFALNVNNIISPENIVIFSIFDGIKWHQIQSLSTINEEWTHLAATISEDSISIYVNGNLEATYSNFETLSQFFVASDSDLTVGAYSAEKRSELSIKNKFLVI